MNAQDSIRRRVLRGLALSREPGYHFPGNFLDISFDRVTCDDALLTIDSGPYCTDADGQMSLGTISLLADLTMAATVRAQLDRSARLATVSMSLQFTGAPRVGRLFAEASFEGFYVHGAERLGASRVVLATNASDDRPQTICFGTGSFMAIPPPANMVLHPIPHRRRDDPDVTIPNDADLDHREREILLHADATLARINGSGESFIDSFWGYHPRKTADGAACTFRNGAHIGNRVGHVQGGVLLGLASVTANAALSSHWALSGITASFVSPGQGAGLRVRSKIVHQGRLTAVVRTQITRPDKRLVLEVVSNHVHRRRSATG